MAMHCEGYRSLSSISQQHSALRVQCVPGDGRAISGKCGARTTEQSLLRIPAGSGDHFSSIFSASVFKQIMFASIICDIDTKYQPVVVQKKLWLYLETLFLSRVYPVASTHLCSDLKLILNSDHKALNLLSVITVKYWRVR